MGQRGSERTSRGPRSFADACGSDAQDHEVLEEELQGQAKAARTWRFFSAASTAVVGAERLQGLRGSSTCQGLTGGAYATLRIVVSPPPCQVPLL